MNICLCEMNTELARRYFREFVVDPDLFLDDQPYRPYVYSEGKADAALLRHWQLGRVYLAVMLGEEPIGEVILKNIDRDQKHCTLGITLRSDEFKNRGYGTAAETLAIRHAFDVMGMETVFADAILKNMRSRHVLEKVGFIETHRDASFAYYRCDRSTWNDLHGV